MDEINFEDLLKELKQINKNFRDVESELEEIRFVITKLRGE